MSNHRWNLSLFLKIFAILIVALSLLVGVLFYYFVITKDLSIYLRVPLLILIGVFLIWTFYSRIKVRRNKTKLPKFKLP